MSVHRQRCPACGSLDVHNLLVREPGAPHTVYVRCARCEAFVARYLLEEVYHHGESVESWLRSHAGEFAESGRRIAEDLAATQQAAEEGYARALAALQRPPEPGAPEETP